MKITEQFITNIDESVPQWTADGLGAAKLQEYFTQANEKLFKEMVMCKFDQDWDKYDEINNELHNRLTGESSSEVRARHNEFMDTIAASNLCQEIVLPSYHNSFGVVARHDIGVRKQPIATAIIGDVI